MLAQIWIQNDDNELILAAMSEFQIQIVRSNLPVIIDRLLIERLMMILCDLDDDWKWSLLISFPFHCGFFFIPRNHCLLLHIRSDSVEFWFIFDFFFKFYRSESFHFTRYQKMKMSFESNSITNYNLSIQHHHHHYYLLSLSLLFLLDFEIDSHHIRSTNRSR